MSVKNLKSKYESQKKLKNKLEKYIELKQIYNFNVEDICSYILIPVERDQNSLNIIYGSSITFVDGTQRYFKDLNIRKELHPEEYQEVR